MSVRFVGERLRPLSRTADTSCLAAGAPGLPLRFLWRDVAIDVARVRRTWRETGACVHGSGERYVRRHWFEVIAATGEVFTLYFERRARRGERKRGRWWLYGIACEGEGVVVAPGCRPNPGER
ncbi:MAG: DUF6504 family protein [Deferrisomatales bacterium]|nr:DUF6504 family protein [Deferrisomatales bacterium]